MGSDPAPTPHFTAQWERVRVVFGDGVSGRLPAELDALGLRRVLLVTTTGRAREVDPFVTLLGPRLAGVAALAVPQVPAERVAEAIAEVDRLEPDALLAVGGGTPIGMAKAVARARSLPIIVLPTTYAGSEMTSIYGITEGDRKTTGRDPRVAPRLVLYDPGLTTSLPARTSAASGMNAIAHAVEAMYATGASPIALAAAEDAIRCLSRALPLIVASPGDRAARSLALRGSHEAGVALELATMGLHHKICHVLGGTFGMPHAETHAAVLPHVVEFNGPAAPDAMQRIAGALGANEAAAGLRALQHALGLATSLAALGFTTADIPRAAALIASSKYPNPRPASESDVAGILARATG